MINVMTEEELNDPARVVQIVPAPPGLVRYEVRRWKTVGEDWGSFERVAVPVVAIELHLDGSYELVVLTVEGLYPPDTSSHYWLLVGYYISPDAPSEEDWRRDEESLRQQQTRDDEVALQRQQSRRSSS